MTAIRKTMRTPLARVRSLGASHSGTSDFWRQRLTAVAMTLLIVPVIVVVLMLLGSNQAGAKQILSSLPIAIIMLLFIIASAWHMKIGMQVVIEDYVHNEKLKLASVMANNFFSYRGGAGLDLRDPQNVIWSLAHGRRRKWQGERPGNGHQRPRLSDRRPYL